MLHNSLTTPHSIAIVGASEDITKPGGRALKNLIDTRFSGAIYPVNPKAQAVQGITAYSSIEALPQVDLAILAIPAHFCVEAVRTLLVHKGTRGIIIYSAGFSELGTEGRKMEEDMAALADQYGASIIGPNCIGIMNAHHCSLFTAPIPVIHPQGCTLVSGSGATCVFILEAAMSRGIHFAGVYSVGNAAQLGVEDIVEDLDYNYQHGISSPLLLLYIESVKQPKKLLQHALSLRKKGCLIAAVKAGSSEAGSRAASSHTGAMLTPDIAIDALLRKAGIVRCYGRDDLCNVAAVLQQPRLRGNRIAIITNAGGPGVMLTDELSKHGLEVPTLPTEAEKELLLQLFAGSSVANPIDILATGTAAQLEFSIDYCARKEVPVDAIIVIYGSPGLRDYTLEYTMLQQKQAVSSKPLYVVMPSVINTRMQMEQYVAGGGIYFSDEVELARALAAVYRTPCVLSPNKEVDPLLVERLNSWRDRVGSGLLSTHEGEALLDALSVERPQEHIVQTVDEAQQVALSMEYPLAVKVVGPAHKTEVGGVALGVSSPQEVAEKSRFMLQIPQATGVQIAQMVSGIEIMMGIKYEPGYGHLITCGMGGIYVEVFKDLRVALAPITHDEALAMVRSLKCYPIIKGIRGKKGIDEELIARTLCRLSDLTQIVPEIEEMDLNPLIGQGDHLYAVDVVVTLRK